MQISDLEMPNAADAATDNVLVAVRVRPLVERERSSKSFITVQSNTTLVADLKPEPKSFHFDHIVAEDATQADVFEAVARPITDYCLQGYNGTIFAYGQTGAGKTHTIQGSWSDASSADYEERGLMPRAFEHIFGFIARESRMAGTPGHSGKEHPQTEFLVKCSYLEIYNEQIMDLLDTSSPVLHLREDIKKGVYVEGVIEEVVVNARDMCELIRRGNTNRHVGRTAMNQDSSRSHAVLSTSIESKTVEEGGLSKIKTSRFHIIDLAGSER